MSCYRQDGCGPYEMRSCNECPASKPEYAQIYSQINTEYNPCIACEYFNKPYWSIVSPCENCPVKFNGKSITTTTITVPYIEDTHVRHGYWIEGLDGSCMCSECGKVSRYEIGHYCPNCGAKMDKEE